MRVALEAEVADLDARVQELESRAVASRETVERGQGRAVRGRAPRRPRAVRRSTLLREQISLDLHAGIDALAEVEPPADDEARATLEAEVAKLTDQIEKIGPVNVLAIEEHQELETRESFLRTQRDDLVQSIESLRQTIRKINLTSRELFREAFNAVNAIFGEIFTSLFGGGTARMQLLDEEDVLESGIELVAQPPGKKNQSIALLSGGERALTAIALLFAIFSYKPSPVLHPRRGRRAARRSQHRALRAPRARLLARHAVHRDHALAPHDGSRGRAVRRDDGRGGLLAPGVASTSRRWKGPHAGCAGCQPWARAVPRNLRRGSARRRSATSTAGTAARTRDSRRSRRRW